MIYLECSSFLIFKIFQVSFKIISLQLLKEFLCVLYTHFSLLHFFMLPQNPTVCYEGMTSLFGINWCFSLAHGQSSPVQYRYLTDIFTFICWMSLKEGMVHDSPRLWMTLVVVLLCSSLTFSIHINAKDQDYDKGHESAQDIEVIKVIIMNPCLITIAGTNCICKKTVWLSL